MRLTDNLNLLTYCSTQGSPDKILCCTAHTQHTFPDYANTDVVDVMVADRLSVGLLTSIPVPLVCYASSLLPPEQITFN